MNKLFIILGLVVTTALSAQVTIEKTTLRSNSSLLEFNDVVETNGTPKGIILPIIDQLNPKAVEQGVIFVDDMPSTKTTNRVVYASKLNLIPLTPKNTDIKANQTLTDGGKGAVITDEKSKLGEDDIPAVLKLVSDNKALVLPHVQNIDQITNPEIGTIVYDRSSKSLAIYNGKVWSFWNK